MSLKHCTALDSSTQIGLTLNLGSYNLTFSFFILIQTGYYTDPLNIHVRIAVYTGNFYMDNFLSCTQKAHKILAFWHTEQKHRCKIQSKGWLLTTFSVRVTQAGCSWQHNLRIKLFFWKLNKHWTLCSACNAPKQELNAVKCSPRKYGIYGKILVWLWILILYIYIFILWFCISL